MWLPFIPPFGRGHSHSVHSVHPVWPILAQWEVYVDFLCSCQTGDAYIDLSIFLFDTYTRCRLNVALLLNPISTPWVEHSQSSPNTTQYVASTISPGVWLVPFAWCSSQDNVAIFLVSNIDWSGLAHLAFQCHIVRTILRNVVTSFRIRSICSTGFFHQLLLCRCTPRILQWSFLPCHTQLSKPQSEFVLHLRWNDRVGRRRAYVEHSITPHVASNRITCESADLCRKYGKGYHMPPSREERYNMHAFLKTQQDYAEPRAGTDRLCISIEKW